MSGACFEDEKEEEAAAVEEKGLAGGVESILKELGEAGDNGEELGVDIGEIDAEESDP